MIHRFYIRMDPWWRPLLLVGGATRENSYAELADDGLTLCFGLLFAHTIKRSQIGSAAKRRWPIWMGIGWRTHLRGLVSLTGSSQGVVELKLTTPERVWRVLSCTRLALSLEDPDGFLDALGVSA